MLENLEAYGLMSFSFSLIISCETSWILIKICYDIFINQLPKCKHEDHRRKMNTRYRLQAMQKLLQWENLENSLLIESDQSEISTTHD